MTGPEVLEIKRTLDGGEQRYRCTLLARTPGWAALRYVLEAPWTVGDVALPEGAETVAHYWTARPYTVYHWLDRDGGTLALYFNAAAEIEIGPAEVCWRDLALDLLVTRDGRAVFLDEGEAAAAPAWARPAIARSREALTAAVPEIVAEVEALTAAVRMAAGAAQQRRTE